MSLLTALLAFVPAVAARKVEEPFLELSQAREDLEHAEDRLADARHQINALSIEVEALRRENRAIRERDLVVISAPLPPLPPEFTELQFAAENVQREVTGRMLAAQMLAAQSQMQALNSQMNMPRGAFERFCTCVPARSDALRRGILGGLNI